MILNQAVTDKYADTLESLEAAEHDADQRHKEAVRTHQATVMAGMKVGADTGPTTLTGGAELFQYGARVTVAQKEQAARECREAYTARNEAAEELFIIRKDLTQLRKRIEIESLRA